MAVVDLRIVCVLGVLYGTNNVLLRAAPASVTYDQRQHGEFNLQVDVKDVALVLLPGGDGGVFAQRNAPLKVANQMQQIFGRRAEPKKKHKNCAATTTAKPEQLTGSGGGYGPSTAGSAAPSSVYPETQTVDGKPSAAASQENAVDSGVNDVKTIVDYDPYSVTPDTPNIFDMGLRGGHLTAVDVADATVVSDRPEKEPPNTDRVKPTETDSEETPAAASVQSSNVNTADEPSKTVNQSVKVADSSSKTDGKNDPAAVNMVTVKTVRKPAETIAVQESADTARVSTKTAAVDARPVEMVAMKTMEKPIHAEALKAGDKPTGAVTESEVTSTSVNLNKKPVEMVALKPVDKTTVAEASKVATTKPAVDTVTVKTAVAEPDVTATSTDSGNKKPTETDYGKPSNAGSAESLEKSEGIAASTKLVGIQENKKTPNDPVDETTVVSRSVPKVTEMVAVKTMENPAALTSAKNVTSTKNVMKSGSPKTTLSSNSSSILRKVGDRKPLPLITLEVATPKVI